MEQYSGFIHLDFDKLTPEQFAEAFKIICSIPYTFLCFRSPSGNGLKVFVEVNTGAEHHDIAYKQVQQFYEEKLGIASDPKCKDITRLCFMSHHPELYKNLSNEKFEIKLSPAMPVQKQPVETNTPNQGPVLPSPSVQSEGAEYEEALLHCQRFTELKRPIQKATAMNLFTCLLQTQTVRESRTKLLCNFVWRNTTCLKKEIRASFRSAYNHHSNEFAKFAKPASSVKQQGQPFEDYLKQTPLIPNELYALMPDILRNGAAVFSQLRERDVFLTGALSILSGCLPGVKGVYDGQEVFPNLYSFTIAPAASGKGALKFAKMLADTYHQTVLQSSKDSEAQYKTEIAEHKAREKAKGKKDTSVEEAHRSNPTFKVIFIPANTSYAKILSHLEQNEGFGIICETEADTMGNVFKQDWGGYSDMLRKAFHHERISSSRKTNNEFIEVDNTQLSVALSGTPGQVVGIICSSEDGLFSRFSSSMLFQGRTKLERMFLRLPIDITNLTEHFKALSRQVFEMVQFLQREETAIDLTDEQWQQLNASCEAWLHMK